jgi:hypothetical protein
MAKDAPQDLRPDDLSNEEIERIEGMLFCMGGPPECLSAMMVWRASLRTSAPSTLLLAV